VDADPHCADVVLDPMAEPWPCAQAHLEDVLPPILNGLADESEGVRQAALASGRTLVDLYALSALELLLPAVERGCAHENWRIRQSSVELLGDLLFKVPIRALRWLTLHKTASGLFQTWSAAGVVG